MYDNATDVHIGTFEFPDWEWASHKRCIIKFADGSVYSFNQNNHHKRFFKPKTWGLHKFEMSNSENFIFYFGSETLGEIECTNENTLLPIACGIFIIDDKFRLSRESD